MKKKGIIIAGAVLVMAALVFAGCGAQPANASNPAPQTVHVVTDGSTKQPMITASGKGEVRVTPDVAYVNVGVTTQSTDAKKAAGTNADKMAALYTAVKALGIAEKDIKTVSYGLYPQYDYNSSRPRITGYTAQNIVSVTVRDVKKVGEVIDAAVTAGGNELNGVSFDLLDKGKAYADALTAAVKDARAKVDAIAGAAGITQISPLTITESSYQTYPIYKAEMPAATMAPQADYAPTQITTGEMTVSANVTVEFTILK